MKPINIVRACLILAALTTVVSMVCMPKIVNAQNTSSDNSTLSPTAEQFGKYYDLYFSKILTIVIPTLLVTIVVSYLGYKKAHTDAKYDKTKLVFTLITAGISSVLTTALGMTPDQVATYTNTGFISIILYWLAQWLSPHLGFIPSTNPSTTTPPTFEYVIFTLTSADTHGSIAPSGLSLWAKDTNVKIMADPSTGYEFDFWEIDKIRTTHPAYFDIVADSDHVFIAHFKPK